MSDLTAGKLIRLEAENIKRLKAVRIDPATGLTIIAGRNDQGKSTVLDALRWAIAGKSGAKDMPDIIRHGEAAARVIAEFEGMTVTRTQVGEKQAVVLEDAEGERRSAPQGLLDQFLNALTFNPLKFAELDGKEQRKVLLGLIGFDPTDIDEKIQSAYTRRTEIGRDVTRLQNVEKSIVKIWDDDTPAEPVSSDTILDFIEKAEEHNRGRAEGERTAEMHHQHMIDARDEIDKLRTQIAAQEERMAKHDRAEHELRLKLAQTRGTVDIEPHRESLRNVETINEQFRARAAADVVKRELEVALTSQQGYTDRIMFLNEQKASALSQAKMPVEGLSLDDDMVLFNGVPLTQASESQRVVVAVTVQMALNPGLRLALVDNLNALGPAKLQKLAELAVEKDFVILGTYVGNSGRSQVVIEDGEVVE